MCHPRRINPHMAIHDQDVIQMQKSWNKDIVVRKGLQQVNKHWPLVADLKLLKLTEGFKNCIICWWKKKEQLESEEKKLQVDRL